MHDGTIDNELDASGDDAIRKGDAGGSEQVFKYERGLVDYVEHLNRSKQVANPSVINFEAETVTDAETMGLAR